jgi:RNA polymerase sigma-70 factor (ECF subfamily)
MDSTPHAPETERHLVERLKAGDTAAFDALFEKHRNGLLAYVAGLTRDRHLAEDIVQESFVRMARQAARLRPEQGAGGWLYRVARNQAIDAIRRRRFETTEPEGSDDAAPARETQDPSAVTPADALAAREREAEVRALLDALPAGERDVLLLRFFGDMTFREAAGVLRRPLGTVLWQAQRALGRMRERMRR